MTHATKRQCAYAQAIYRTLKEDGMLLPSPPLFNGTATSNWICHHRPAYDRIKKPKNDCTQLLKEAYNV